MVFATSIAVLTGVAAILPKSDGLHENKTSFKPVIYGFILSLIFMLGLDLFLAGNKVSLILYFLAWVATILVIAKILKYKNWLTSPALILFGLGVYTVLGITGAISGIIKGRPEALVIGIIFEVFFIFTARKIIKRS